MLIVVSVATGPAEPHDSDDNNGFASRPVRLGLNSRRSPMRCGSLRDDANLLSLEQR
jgi:hypothetical protein